MLILCRAISVTLFENTKYIFCAVIYPFEKYSIFEILIKTQVGTGTKFFFFFICLHVLL